MNRINKPGEGPEDKSIRQRLADLFLSMASRLDDRTKGGTLALSSSEESGIVMSEVRDVIRKPDEKRRHKYLALKEKLEQYMFLPKRRNEIFRRTSEYAIELTYEARKEGDNSLSRAISDHKAIAELCAKLIEEEGMPKCDLTLDEIRCWEGGIVQRAGKEDEDLTYSSDLPVVLTADSKVMRIVEFDEDSCSVIACGGYPNFYR